MTRLTYDDHVLNLTSDGTTYSVSSSGRVYHMELLEETQGRLDLLIDGRRTAAYVSAERQARWVTIDGRTFRLTRKMALAQASAGHDGSSELAAPMPGQVRAVNVLAGDRVTKGQVVIVLEAMKMEIRLQAPFDAQVSSVDATVGQTVEREQVLVKLERHQHAPP